MLNFDKKDWLIAAAIFLLAALLRFPNLEHPPVAVFDEATYVNFVTRLAQGEPFFTVHPPGGILIFWSLIPQAQALTIIPDWFYRPYGDFPYANLRGLTALMGSLLPVFIFFIGRLLFQTRNGAIVAALLIIFDRAFIVYSRLILPDTILIACGFLALLMVILYGQKEDWKYRIILLLCAGLSLGMSISIKWIGLGFWGTAVYFLLKQRGAVKNIILITVPMLMVYVIVSLIYFSLFQSGTPYPFVFRNQTVASLQFPPGNDVKAVAEFIPTYAKAMLAGHAEYVNDHPHASASRPYYWLINQSPIYIWTEGQKKIIFQGNQIAWLSALLAVVSGLIFWRRHDPILRLLLIGYLVNLVPFFFIKRILFPYHYLAALPFAYLLVPIVLDLAAEKLRVNKLHLSLAFAVVLIGSFFLLLPTTYGF